MSTKTGQLRREALRQLQRILSGLPALSESDSGAAAALLFATLNQAFTLRLKAAGVKPVQGDDGCISPPEGSEDDAPVSKGDRVLASAVAELALKGKGAPDVLTREDRGRLQELIEAGRTLLQRYDCEMGRLLERQRTWPGRILRPMVRILAVLAMAGLVFILLYQKYGPIHGTVLDLPLKTRPGRPGGIEGAYYRTINLSGQPIFRTDRRIDFNWPKYPIRGLPLDRFSIEWKGALRFWKAGKCWICTHSDDGTALMLQNKLVIDDWKVHGPKHECRLINIAYPGWYSLRLRFFDERFGARIRLYLKEMDGKVIELKSRDFCCQKQ